MMQLKGVTDYGKESIKIEYEYKSWEIQLFSKEMLSEEEENSDEGFLNYLQHQEFTHKVDNATTDIFGIIDSLETLNPIEMVDKNLSADDKYKFKCLLDKYKSSFVKSFTDVIKTVSIIFL